MPACETLAAQDILALQEQGTYIILNPSLNSAWRRSAQDLLSGLGRVSCEVRDGLGQPGFRVWYLPGMVDICS